MYIRTYVPSASDNGPFGGAEWAKMAALLQDLKKDVILAHSAVNLLNGLSPFGSNMAHSANKLVHSAGLLAHSAGKIIQIWPIRLEYGPFGGLGPFGESPSKNKAHSAKPFHGNTKP